MTKARPDLFERGSMLKVSFSIVRFVEDKWPTEYTMPWDQLAIRLADHREGTKGGSALVCGLFGRDRLEGGNARARQLIALDIELNKETGVVPPGFSAIAALMAAKRQCGVLWTTHSHTEAEPRYRVVLPIDQPVNLRNENRELDKMLTTQVALQLGLEDVCDQGKRTAESLFFLARHDAGKPFMSQIVEGTPIVGAGLYSDAFHVVEHLSMRRAQLQALRQSHKFPDELKALIEDYNANHEISDLLHKYGYSRHGNRWKSGYQSPTSQPATAIFPDKTGAYSWSESDRAAGLGLPCDDGVFFDGFALFCHYEHDGSFREAINRLKEASDAG